jgi:hypothetical protein
MCKQRELTVESLITDVHHSASETLIRTLMRKQLTLKTLIDTVTTTADAERRKSACRGIVDIMRELNRIDAVCTCSLN